MKKIGFIGLGHMGHPMVKNLLDKKFDVTVYDVNRNLIPPLVQYGAHSAATIAELTHGKDVIITMVQTGEQVKQCCLGEEGIFHHLKPDALFIDSSSIDIKNSHELHQLAEERKLAMVDAPVSGGVAGAESANLTFMVGGNEKNFDRAKTVLSVLGKNIIYAGSGGSGVAAKICNNMLLGISMIAVSESFNLADKMGLAPEKFYEICSQSSGQCWSLTHYCPWPGILENAPSNNAYKPGFMAKMMLKDLKLSQDAAKISSSYVPLGEKATELYQQFVNQGHGDLDFSGIINMLKD